MSRPESVAQHPKCETCETRLQGIFASLDQEALARLDRTKVAHPYKRGQILHYEGNAASSVSCLRTGRAKVYKSAPRDRQHILYLAEPGDVIGLESVIVGKHHTSTAEMLESGIICHLDREELLRILRSQPETLRAIVKMFAAQLLRSEAERAELASGSVRERMALMLLSLAGRYGVRTDGGVRLSVALSREEIAEMVGTTPETAIRHLSEFRSEGLLSTRGRMILIEDPVQLARIARLAEIF